MSAQVTSLTGLRIWDLTGTDWKALAYGQPGDRDRRWVQWNGRRWLRKCEPRSLSEIAGYLVAEAIGLPVQPWIGFFEREKSNEEASRIMTGILVERWPGITHLCNAGALSAKHAELVSLALAITAFQRSEGEDPEFAISDRNGGIRLIDLDGFGPHFRYPPEGTSIQEYIDDSRKAFYRTLLEAVQLKVKAQFERSLRQVLLLKCRNLFDFSGHPHDQAIRLISCRAFDRRVAKIRRLLD